MIPTEEFVKQSLALSQEFLADSAASLDEGRLRTCIDRAYYSMHHAAIGLLTSRGIRPPRSHRGLVNLFGEEIVNRGLIDKEFGRILSSSLGRRMRST